MNQSQWPAISIVTPCLNAADTIGRALESVRTQGYPDVEHIVSALMRARRARSLVSAVEIGRAHV